MPAVCIVNGEDRGAEWKVEVGREGWRYGESGGGKMEIMSGGK